MTKVVTVRFNAEEWEEMQEKKSLFEKWLGMKVSTSRFIKYGLDRSYCKEALTSGTSYLPSNKGRVL